MPFPPAGRPPRGFHTEQLRTELQHPNADILILMFFMGGQWNKTTPAVNSSQEFGPGRREADVADHVSDTSGQEKKKKQRKKEGEMAPTSLCGSDLEKVCEELSTLGQLSGDTLTNFILPRGKKTKQNKKTEKSRLGETAGAWK